MAHHTPPCLALFEFFESIRHMLKTRPNKGAEALQIAALSTIHCKHHPQEQELRNWLWQVVLPTIRYDEPSDWPNFPEGDACHPLRLRFRYHDQGPVLLPPASQHYCSTTSVARNGRQNPAER